MLVTPSTPPERFAGHRYPQVIPVPDEVEVGQPAPWAHLPASARRAITSGRVLERLRASGRTLDVAPLPREPAELAAIEATSRTITRRSAVLVALFDEDGEAHVILTRRSFELRAHRGEIALPGGASDEGEDPIATALREAHEEVGLDPSRVTPAGWLNPLVTFASGSAIWPVVASLRERPRLVADPVEVDRVFTVALKDLVEEGAFLEERWRRAERRPGSDDAGFFPLYFYRVPGDVIWGATARVLTELLCVALDVTWPEEGRRWG
jgi:8-oxo-dGTP pyrophosphatase MutT (NUDIX family)